MTEQNLDRLFEAARNSGPVTSANEVSHWIAGAAIATGAGIGLAAKFKLLLTKKMIIMLTGTFGVVSTAVVITAAAFNNDPGNTTNNVVTQDADNKIDNTKIQIDSPEPTVEQNEAGTFEFIPSQMMGVASTGDDREVPAGRTDMLFFPQVDHGFVKDDSDVTAVLSPLAPIAPIAPLSNLGMLLYIPAGEDTTGSNSSVVVSAFHRLELIGVYDAYIVQGDAYKIEVESDETGQVMINEDEGVVTISSNGGEGCEGGENRKRDRDKKEDFNGVVLRITVKDLSELYMSCIGNVTVSGLQVNKLSVEFTGVGDVSLGVACKDFSLYSSGIGNVKISGKSEKAEIEYTGVGDVDAFDFAVEELVMNGSGIGNVMLHAQKSITINSSGVGDVKYKGNPTSTDVNFSGIGSVKHKME